MRVLLWCAFVGGTLAGCSSAFVEVEGRVQRADTDTGMTADSGETADTGDTADSAWAPMELCLNEFMPDTVAAVVSDAGEPADWIELHNPGRVDVPLAGWALTDDGDDPGLSPLPTDMVLPAGGFVVFWADEGVAIGNTHLDFALDADGGEVGLYAPDGQGDLITYGAVAGDFSVARTPDCCTEAGCFGFDYRGTPGTTNGEASEGERSTAQTRQPLTSPSRR